MGKTHEPCIRSTKLARDLSFTSPPSSIYLRRPTPSNSSQQARPTRWIEEEEQAHQHVHPGPATIGGDAATKVLIAPGSISRVRARRRRRRLGGIASAVDGNLSSKRRVPLSPQHPVGSMHARYRWVGVEDGPTDAWMRWSWMLMMRWHESRRSWKMV